MTGLTYELKNGIRVLFYPTTESDIAHCAVMIKAGTRNEEKGKEGLAHFIEHMLFKGTEKRKSFHILNRLEVVGGELNAFTSKEETCVHASFLTPYFERASELINDLCFHSVFPVKEMEKEKEVICDEIRTYLDTPGEQIYDDFEGMLFKNNALGNPILGTELTVRSFKRKDLVHYTQSNYYPSDIVFAVAGNLKEQDVLKIAEKYFSNYKSRPRKTTSKKFANYKADQVTVKKHNAQCHYMMGTIAQSLHHTDRLKMVLLNNILGGPGMNSRLNLGIREKYGYTYTIESGFNSYSDTGTFHVYLATDKKHLDKSIMLAGNEMKKLATQKISTVQLNQYKQQFKGQIALSRDNKANMMISSAKSILNFNKPLNITETYKKIDAITAVDLVKIAGDYLDSKSPIYSSLLYENIEG